MIKTPKSFIFSITLLIIIVSFCSRKDNNSERKIIELTFEVDSTKLESPTSLRELGIQFNVPKGWSPIAQSIFEEFSKQSSSIFLAGSDISVVPVSIFLEKEHQSLLYISQFPDFGDSSGVNQYKRLIEKNFSPQKVGNFLKDDILFTQYLIQDGNWINFKLLFFNLNNQLIQFDYLITREFYLSEIKAIESSIGSIKLIG